ncbi:MAG TPA: hypothetical protein DHW82_12305 [Spirochaetia bacterium]|nr:MAG: hypothetical protein A2Y41_02850 [Spirochaetes bacterium GWB1_36_13]HCL57773.1 hypothetical protein [Spirochaetia bacterium]
MKSNLLKKTFFILLLNAIGVALGVYFRVPLLFLLGAFIGLILIWAVFALSSKELKSGNAPSKYSDYLNRNFFEDKIRPVRQAKHQAVLEVLEDMFDLASKISLKEKDYSTTLEYTVYQAVSLGLKISELMVLAEDESLGDSNITKIKKSLLKLKENLSETKQNLAGILTNLSLGESNYSKININKELSFLNKTLEETMKEENEL